MHWQLDTHQNKIFTCEGQGKKKEMEVYYYPAHLMLAYFFTDRYKLAFKKYLGR